MRGLLPDSVYDIAIMSDSGLTFMNVFNAGKPDSMGWTPPTQSPVLPFFPAPSPALSILPAPAPAFAPAFAPAPVDLEKVEEAEEEEAGEQRNDEEEEEEKKRW
jgi:hypothetical protein